MKYKSAFFLNSFERNTCKVDIDENESETLTDFIVSQFYEKKDILIQGIVSNDDSLNQNVLNSLLEFSKFTPINRVAGLLTESEITKHLMKFICYPYRMIVLQIFANISFSEQYIETLVVDGMLDFIYDDIFNVNEDVNIHIRNIISNIIYLSDFTRALLYSTNIFAECISKINGNFESNLYEEWVSKILMMFCFKGPLKENIHKFPEYHLMYEKWVNFQNVYQYRNVFFQNLFEEFCSFGICLSNNNLPFKYLFDFFLKKAESTIAIVNFINAMKFYLKELVNTSNASFAENLILPFQQFVQRISYGEQFEINCFVDVILKIYVLLYSINIDENNKQFLNCGKEAIELIVHMLQNSDFNNVSEAALAISNLIASFPIITSCILENENIIEYFRKILTNGKFQERSAVAWLFFVLMVNQPDFVNYNDIQGLVDMMESQTNYEFTKQALKCFDYVFSYQEEHEPEGRSIINYFDDCNGFEVLTKIEEETSNIEIRELVNNFYDKFSNVNIFLS